THRTGMAVSSALAQAFATLYCLGHTPDDFSPRAFLSAVVEASRAGKKYFPETLKDDITERFQVLEHVTGESRNEDFVRDFGAGSVYVYNSLPFTYAFFVRNPTGIEAHYDCVSSGGDTDSNASMLGGLLGALHGTAVFPKELAEGLHRKD